MELMNKYQITAILLTLCCIVGSCALTLAASDSDYFPIDEFMEHGMDEPFMSTYKGQPIYGMYDTRSGMWKMNELFYDPYYEDATDLPPDDYVSLIAEYENDVFVGFNVIGNAAFKIGLPVRAYGKNAFYEDFGDYIDLGFDAYRYDGKSILGFWDEKEQKGYVSIDPSTGLLIKAVDIYGQSAYIIAVYDDNDEARILEVEEADFHEIDGVKAMEASLHEKYLSLK